MSYDRVVPKRGAAIRIAGGGTMSITIRTRVVASAIEARIVLSPLQRVLVDGTRSRHVTQLQDDRVQVHRMNETTSKH